VSRKGSRRGIARAFLAGLVGQEVIANGARTFQNTEHMDRHRDDVRVALDRDPIELR